MKNIISTAFCFVVFFSHAQSNIDCMETIQELETYKSKLLEENNYEELVLLQEKISERKKENKQIVEYNNLIERYTSQNKYAEAGELQLKIKQIEDAKELKQEYCSKLRSAIDSKNYSLAAIYQDKLKKKDEPTTDILESNRYKINTTPQNTSNVSNYEPEKKLMSKKFILYSISETAGFGIVAGDFLSDEGGPYYSSRVSLSDIDINTDGLECDAFGVTNGDNGADYDWTGEEVISRYSITAGAIFTLDRNKVILGSIGLGYGSIKFLHAYNKRSGSITYSTEYWAEHYDWRIAGLEAESSIYLNLGGFILSSGLSTINFSYYEYTGGIGFLF